MLLINIDVSLTQRMRLRIQINRTHFYHDVIVAEANYADSLYLLFYMKYVGSAIPRNVGSSSPNIYFTDFLQTLYAHYDSSWKSFNATDYSVISIFAILWRRVDELYVKLFSVRGSFEVKLTGHRLIPQALGVIATRPKVAAITFHCKSYKNEYKKYTNIVIISL